MKTIISTGLGRLHLVQSALSLHEAGVDVRIVQGWVPRHIPKGLVNSLGILVGSKNLYAGMKKRFPSELSPTQIHSCTTADFYTQGLFILAKLGLLSRSEAACSGWKYFGRSSKIFLHSADIFHVRSGAGQGGAIEMARLKGMKVVVDHSIAHPAFIELMLKQEYESRHLLFTMSPKDPFWKMVLKDCQEADMLLVNSDFVKKTFIDYGYISDKIKVITQGVRDDFLHLKEDYRLNGPIKLLFTGGFGFRKGAQYLIHALEELDRSNIDFELTVVGSSSEAVDLINETTVQSKIRFIGHVPQEELKKYLAEADLYVFPTLAEGCASSGLEAMAAGLPVITTRESGLPITNRKNGFLVPTKSSADIADAIHLLRSDDDQRTMIGKAAYETIKEKYSWQQYALQVKSLYKSIL
ncbi:MAG TPA: glycosyltransferase family 4 protein [Candidatus Moranbacteria bacterium]|nr:glycosyltransferase family 4 protein [Candidatus Moranbacteria bacterium]